MGVGGGERGWSGTIDGDLRMFAHVVVSRRQNFPIRRLSMANLGGSKAHHDEYGKG